MARVEIPCRSAVAQPGEFVRFNREGSDSDIWVDVRQDKESCSVKITVQDFLDVARQLNIALPHKEGAPKKEGARLETLKDIHAALGKIIG